MWSVVVLLAFSARAEDVNAVNVGLSLSERGLLQLAEGGVRKVFVTIESDHPLTELHRIGVVLLIIGIILLPGSGTDVVMEPGPAPASMPLPQGPGIPPPPPGAPTSI